MPTATDTPTTLRRALQLDAAASGGLGALLVFAAAPLAPMLGLPEPLLLGAGLFLLPFALGLLALAPRAGRLRSLTRFVVVGNVGWVAASGLLLVSGVVAPTLLGQLFVLGQAIAVAEFAYLEHKGLGTARRDVLRSAA